MKTKTLRKKLILNKKTIIDLGNGVMNMAHGGGTKTCDTCIPEDSVCLICTGDCTAGTCRNTCEGCSGVFC